MYLAESEVLQRGRTLGTQSVPAATPLDAGLVATQRGTVDAYAERGAPDLKRVEDLSQFSRRKLTVAESKYGEDEVQLSKLRSGLSEQLDVGNEQYAQIVENRFASVGDEPLSTFSIDVDTASYANARRFLAQNQMPPANAIRIEEFINYFSYDYPAPREGEPFSVNMEVAQCPWQPAHQLVRIGLKGKEVPQQQRPASNIVFLLDVSGSMQDANKLPLLKQAMKLLTDQLTESDRVSIVTYAGNAGLALDTTNGESKQTIRDAIDALNANGSTNGSAGIQLAYEKATQSFIKEGANRVILATDGDLNVGVTDDDALVELIKQKAASGVFLTVLGFGEGNLKDGKLEKLADNGNGMYAYIDSLREARKVLVEQITGSLVTIAKDVKIKVEFNPAEVAAYRLLGYENRLMSAPDFDNDAKDAGEIGAGHTVTALYEIVPSKVKEQLTSTAASLKYQRPVTPT
ncbi:MAG: von Willebrand factor type A domain-containing protein, partial [Planctomycetia bacterium]|nr:von Willebrand factor type A domain-containing protein [Planctomycetia bacterium]